MRSSRFLPIALCLSLLAPATALALEGIGPRVTVVGVVEEITLTEKQEFEDEGGQLVITATNGQRVTIVLTKDTTIMSEGRLSRKLLVPWNITVGMQARVRGWRVDSKTLTASLFVILNVQLNPALSNNGVIQSIEGSSMTILAQDGLVRAYTLTNETEVQINYTLRGADALSLIGKRAILTLNPNNTSQVRIVRISGNSDPVKTVKPPSNR